MSLLKRTYRIALLLPIICMSLSEARQKKETVSTESIITTTDVVVEKKKNKKDGKHRPGLVFFDEENDFEASLRGKFVNATNFSDNASLLNSTAKGAFGNKIDESVVNNSKLDLTAHLKHVNVESQFTARTRFAWGSDATLKNSNSTIGIDGVQLGNHSHNLQLKTLYLQEGWVTVKLNGIAESDLLGEHSFTAGAFSYSVGRGIALGDAYLVNPTSLGFYSDRTVDMYAPGAKLSGDFFTSKLRYDLYTAVQRNSSRNVSETGALIYDQLILNGIYPKSPARGYGKIDWILAGRLQGTPFNNKDKNIKLVLEPYAVYASDPSQKVKSLYDAIGKLSTFGFACEFTHGDFEFGIDAAFNRGHQKVLGWDNNAPTWKTVNGVLTKVFSGVYSDAALTTNLVYSPTLVSTVRPTPPVSEALNGQQIGTTGYYSGKDRFRDAYTNKYRGFMIVGDASMFIYKHDLRLAVTAGVASGDKLPTTKEGSERVYEGFVPLQEMYAGKRVKSYFVMGGGALLRPTPFNEDENQLLTVTDSFSDLIFTGMSFTFAPEHWERKITINPNVLTYWTYARSYTTKTASGRASNQLGTEISLFSKYHLTECAIVNVSGAVFFPGKHYSDIKGLPLASQRSDALYLISLGSQEEIPTIGDSTAFTMSVGLEYLI